MKSRIRKLGLTAGLVVSMSGLGVGVATVTAHADGQGATTVPCSDFFEGVQGTIVINSNGIIINCFEHTQGDMTPPPATGAEVIDCTEALGFPAKGIAVTTPTGSVLINCHPHFITTGP